jgi:hypothetical protein
MLKKVFNGQEYFFFFYWCYNPLWVLAFSVIFFHSALPSHCFLHRLTPIICKSSSMPAIHLFCDGQEYTENTWKTLKQWKCG